MNINMPTYISKKGLQDLKEEHENRIKNIRKEIAKKISDAKELGDLSENFEYHDAKEQQGTNEIRILEIEKMIKDSIVIEETTGNNEISLGVTFIAELNGNKKTYTIVGYNESSPMEGKISNESPIGRAFMGKTVNDIVTVEIPSGKASYKILEIK